MNPDLTVYTTLGSFQNQNDKRTFKTTIPANEFTKEQSLSIAGLDDLESNEVVVVVLNRNQTDLESNKPLPYHATNNNNNNNILPNENKRKNPGYPGSDIAFYILLVGFTAMYTLSTLLRDLIPNKDPNIRLFFAALGTISLVTAPLVYLYKTKMNLRKMLRLKKEKADSQIFRYSIIISFGMVVDILLLSAILLSNSNSDPKKDAETNPKKKEDKSKSDQTNKIHVIQTSIKSTTRSKTGTTDKFKTSLEDVDLEKLKKIPKISPLIKSTLEFSVLSRGQQVEKRLDFRPFIPIGSEIFSLLSNLSLRCSTRQNELGHQLVELERVCTLRKDESIVFLNTFEKSQQHVRFQLFQLRTEIGNLGKLINNTIDRNLKILSLIPNSLNIVKETNNFKRTIFAIESKKNNSQTATSQQGPINERERENEKEKEKEKIFNQEQIWKSFIKRRKIIQTRTITHEIVENVVEKSIKKITKKWVLKKKKRKERKLRELQQQQKPQKSQQKKREKHPKQQKQGEHTKKIQKKKTNIAKSKEEKKDLNLKEKRNQKKNSNQSQLETKSKKKSKHRKAHKKKRMKKSDDLISKEEQLRIENEKMKKEIEMLKKMQEQAMKQKK
ncbi:transcription initiation factor tfiid subunit 3 [Anaeramoeba flamelloides]|uniref:Transcription initiation factor tfiid subunit 3 n=1 Tax=Anaeramoeba flamelloides TaxID=1746091 RepID=A0ABQ8YPN6_9EUKA|nr:transcription initiation factor tfiid subunit 3 [Anaeramoeba flamelloides]